MCKTFVNFIFTKLLWKVFFFFLNKINWLLLYASISKIGFFSWQWLTGFETFCLQKLLLMVRKIQLLHVHDQQIQYLENDIFLNWTHCFHDAFLLYFFRTEFFTYLIINSYLFKLIYLNLLSEVHFICRNMHSF